MKLKKLFRVTAAVSAMVPCSILYAQDEMTESSLQSIVVSASRSDTRLNEMTQNATVIDSETIQNSPEGTVDQILKGASGIYLNDQPFFAKDPTGQSINMRGLGNARALVLIDGIPALDAMYGTVQWSLVPLSSIQDVEIIRGGVSNLYGNYGMGGLINIMTKPITDSAGDVSGSWGRYSTGTFAGMKDFAPNDAMKLRISVDNFNTAGYLQGVGFYPAAPYVASGANKNTSTSLTPYMQPERANNSNFRIQGEYRFSADTVGTFNMGYHTMENATGGGYAGLNKNTEESTFSGTLAKILNGSEKIQANVYYEKTRLIQQNASLYTTGTPYYIYESAYYIDPYTQMGGSLQYTNNLNKGWIQQLVLDVDARQLMDTNSTWNLNSAGATTSTAYASGQQQFYGALAQVKSKPLPIPLEATLSLRVDQYNSQVSTYDNVGYTGGQPGTPNYVHAPDVTISRLSPNLGLLYQLNSGVQFRAAAYDGFHAPGLNNLTRTYGSSGSYSVSNPYLTPEIMKGYEGGIDFSWKHGYLKLTEFDAQIQHAIVAATMTSAQLSTYCPSSTICTSGTLYGNGQSLLSYGTEIDGHYDPIPQISLDGSFSHTNTMLTWDGAGVSAVSNPLNSQLGGVPQNKGFVAVTWYAQEKTSLSANMNFVSQSWLDTAHTLRAPGYAVFGAKLNYQMNSNTNLFVSGVNILSRDYATYASGTSQSSYIRGEPLNITLGARYSF
jgi:iron complex outermembrane receptor protein